MCQVCKSSNVENSVDSTKIYTQKITRHRYKNKTAKKKKKKIQEQKTKNK